MADSLNTPTLPKTENWLHPVDQMSMALHKIDGILAAVMGNYDDLPDGDFKIPSRYIHIALFACADLLDEAKAGLDRFSDEFTVTEKPEALRARGQS